MTQPAQDPLTLPGPWNAVAVGYDEELTSKTPGFLDAAIEMLRPGAGDNALDVATGPGPLALRLASKVARVVAIDFAENMIARLRRHVAREGITNLDAREMDGTALELDDASFDLAASMFGWFLFADRARGLAEMRRVLRPGGRLLVTSWMPPEKNGLLGAGLTAVRAALPDLPRPAGPLPTQIPEVCAAEVRDAGFEDVTTRVVVVSVPVASVDEHWRSFERAGAPLVLLKKKLGEAAWQSTVEKVKAALRERYGTGAFTLEGAAIFTSGRRAA